MYVEKPLEMLKRARDVTSQRAPIIFRSAIFAKLAATTLLNQNLHHAKSRLLPHQAVLKPPLEIVMHAAQESMFFAKFVANQCAKIIVVSMIKLSAKNVL
jgi:hypothetical protein